MTAASPGHSYDRIKLFLNSLELHPDPSAGTALHGSAASDRVSGVRLHTSNIFFKCCTDCRSPESCHLKTGCLSINVTIASIHRGSWSLSSRRCIASFTFGNLYRPFKCIAPAAGEPGTSHQLGACNTLRRPAG